MTIDEQKVAVAETFGWVFHPYFDHGTIVARNGTWRRDEKEATDTLPDYRDDKAFLKS